MSQWMGQKIYTVCQASVANPMNPVGDLGMATNRAPIARTIIRRPHFLAWLSLLTLVTSPLHSTEITLKNGTRVSGASGRISGLNQDPNNPDPTGGEITVSQIILLDDQIRRVYIPSKQVAAVADGDPVVEEKIRIQQRVPRTGRKISAIGAIHGVTPFDEYGRRIFSMDGPKRQRLDLVQGITEITPRYTKVECLLGKDSYIWTMYIATSSIPRQTLSRILMRQIDPKNLNERLRVVTLYLQAERFKEARIEMEQIIEDFPDAKDLKKQVVRLRQQGARRLIREIEARQRAGQHRLAFTMLNQFPEEGVAGETLLRVREMLEEYEDLRGSAGRVVKLLDEHMSQLEMAAKDDLTPAVKEMKAGLTINTLDRMADYLRLGDAKDLKAGEKVSLAVSGWILGSGSATENLAVSTDLILVRDAVQKYLASSSELDRSSILAEIEGLEGGTPEYISKILANMKPPKFTDETPTKPGFYELKTRGLDRQGDITYYVQLPPEYDPNRRYPCIVTLNGSGTTPEKQIDWWAGSYRERDQMRLGQASRQGYIVVAPKWSEDRQRRYNFTAKEHAAVLKSLGDAMSRCSIDSDKVFLTGHSMGGDAAWDIGLSHPDLWAGVLPIVASSDRYITRYWENGRGLPMYFVAGEMDGNRLSENAIDLDRYLTKVGYDVTVVEYKGRGHESFSDEIQNMFDWMRVQQRDFTNREFKALTMRSWDNFFWWVEIDGFPNNSIVPPATWPNTKAKPAITEARIVENNIFVKSGASKVTVYLTPDMVDFNQKIRVTVNRRGRATEIRPDVNVMLEDARTRRDRRHPFWAKVTN